MQYFKKLVIPLLVTGFMMPAMVVAQDDCCNKLDNVKRSVDQMRNDNNQDNQEIINQLRTSEEHLGKLWNNKRNDMTLRKGITALINFQAAENFRRYLFDLELLFMPAPGSGFAIQAGKNLGLSEIEKNALLVSDKSLIGFYGLLTGRDEIKLNDDEKINLEKMAKDSSPVRLFDEVKNFFLEGKVDKINILNPGALMHANTLADANLDKDSSQRLINLLINPFPMVDKTLKNEFAFGGVSLTGEQKEDLVRKLVGGSVMGLSTSAFGDIVARRMIPEGDDKSFMQVLGEHTNQRFSSPDWYKEVGAASDTALLRELAHMQAFNLWMQNQQFRMNEQQMALLASINAIMAKVNKTMDQMLISMELAKAQAEAYGAQGERQLENITIEDDEEKKKSN